MKKISHFLFFSFFKTFSKLPFSLLYFISDILYLLAFYGVKYRRKVVEQNIRESFPEKTLHEQELLIKGFYHFFCDYIVETIKMLTISEKEMRKRMRFKNISEMEKSLENNRMLFIYLGHFCNWEWFASLQLWLQKGTQASQLYRPLKNKLFDQLFLDLRGRFGSVNISKYESLRQIIKMKSGKKKTIVGFISDQSPRPANIHDWVPFLNHATPVFTGTERIAKKVNAAVYFTNVKRIRRGYYEAEFVKFTDTPQQYPDYEITEGYMKALEILIKEQPSFWLWSHKRWKYKKK